MTVSDLIAKLQWMNPDWPVMMATDEEGNHYFPLADVESARWAGEMSGYGGNPVHPDDTAEDHSVGDLADLPSAVVLWP